MSLRVQLWLARPSNGGLGKTKTRAAGSERGIALRQAVGRDRESPYHQEQGEVKAQALCSPGIQKSLRGRFHGAVDPGGSGSCSYLLERAHTQAGSIWQPVPAETQAHCHALLPQSRRRREPGLLAPGVCIHLVMSLEFLKNIS